MEGIGLIHFASNTELPDCRIIESDLGREPRVEGYCFDFFRVRTLLGSHDFPGRFWHFSMTHFTVFPEHLVYIHDTKKKRKIIDY